MNTMSCLLVWPMPHGLFQELMSIVLHGPEDFTLAYLDDIIFSASKEEHKQDIKIFFFTA